MHEVAVTGVDMTAVTAGFGKNLTELFVEAANEAVEDAGVDRLDSKGTHAQVQDST